MRYTYNPTFPKINGAPPEKTMPKDEQEEQNELQRAMEARRKALKPVVEMANTAEAITLDDGTRIPKPNADKVKETLAKITDRQKAGKASYDKRELMQKHADILLELQVYAMANPDRFNSWEKEFIDSVKIQWEEKHWLSDKQMFHIDRIMKDKPPYLQPGV